MAMGTQTWAESKLHKLLYETLFSPGGQIVDCCEWFSPQRAPREPVDDSVLLLLYVAGSHKIPA